MGMFWKRLIFGVIVLFSLVTLISLFYLFKPFFFSASPSNVDNTSLLPKTAVPGKCLLLENQSCSQAELIEWANPNGEKLPLIGLRLTPGTPLLMPVDGKVTKAKLPDNGVFKGFQAQIADPNSPNPTWYIVTGNLQFDDMRSPDLKKGTVFGHIGETGVKNAGDFDLLFYIIQGTGQQAAPAIDKMKEMFPSSQK